MNTAANTVPQPAPTAVAEPTTHEFSVSLLCPWVKGSVSTDYRFVNIVHANTIFGLFPAGSTQKNFALKNINGATVDKKFHGVRMAFGAILALAGLCGIFEPNGFLSGLILLALGVILFLSGIENVLKISSGADGYIVEAPFWESGTLSAICAEVTHAQAVDTDKTDLNMFFNHKN